MKSWTGLFLTLLCGGVSAEDQLIYRLSYATGTSGRVFVQIQLPQPAKAPLTLIMPRTYPGGYAQIGYDGFVSAVTSKSPEGMTLTAEKNADGPRWSLGQSGDHISMIGYEVDVTRMEATLHDAVSSSKVRNGYVGLLGYSVFGFVEGYESQKILLQVQGPADWPLLLTVTPSYPSSRGTASALAADYYELADSQILMGPRLKINKVDGAIPLLMAIYAEGEVDVALEAKLAREALDRVQAYFDDKPIAQYTVQLELLHPLAGHEYGFSQEHIASGTFSLSVEAALHADSAQSQQERARFNFAHHMAHSWIPKRTYGVGYRPFSWEMTPVIDTIWFNEGFGRYAAIVAIAAGMPMEAGSAFRQSELQKLRALLDDAPRFIRRMPLEVLSREASFLYASDFRTGRNVFARGALMAAQMDERITTQTHGKKSLADALRWLLRWSAEHQQPFQSADLPTYFATATGVDVADIYQSWQQSQEKP